MATATIAQPTQPPTFSPSIPAPSTTATTTTTISSPLATTIQDTDHFIPEKHLTFSPPSKIYTMADIGLPADTGVSPVAVSEPFPLFTPEAIARMRAEILSEPVLNTCQFSSNLAQAQLRGYADKYAPFVYDAWTHPDTMAAVSQVAGIDLALQFDYEVAHINLSFPKVQDSEPEEDAPIVGWHTDSYPFVCVAMLSDCTNMIGGETALKTGTGEILKVRGPQMGHAVVLQGRYITHQALRALGTTERITMVTSYRPRDPFVRDDTVLTTVRPISDLGELYSQFAAYRLEMLRARVDRQLEVVREYQEQRRRRLQGAMGGNGNGGGGGEEKEEVMTTRQLKKFLKEQVEFLTHMDREIVDEEEVIKGNIDEPEGGLKFVGTGREKGRE